MDYEELIRTEDTDCFYEAWSDYRKNVTDYIIENGFESVNDREGQENKRPVLAIWGAGGCNDIDIIRLNRHFRLVLIDKDIDKLIEARRKFLTDDSDCICVDMCFWNIEDEDYLMFEAMLKDGLSDSELKAYLEELVLRNGRPNYKDLPRFDVSVIIGVASQLNVRFAAMAHMYNRYEVLLATFNYMNYEAVWRMMDAVCEMTSGKTIVGYEVKNTADSSIVDSEAECYGYDKLTPDIAGSSELEGWIAFKRANSHVDISAKKYLLWEFSPYKRYIMSFLTFDNIV